MMHVGCTAAHVIRDRERRVGAKIYYFETSLIIIIRDDRLKTL